MDLLADMTLSYSICRASGPRHGYTFYTIGDTRPTDRPRSTCTSSTMSTTTTIRATTIDTANTTTSGADEAPSRYHRSTYYCAYHAFGSSVRQIPCHHVFSGHTHTYLGLGHGQASKGASAWI